jgi:CRISPR-associated protein Csx14
MNEEMPMASTDIPVDLFNPGQVFACLGFLEAADILLGDAEGGFDWSDEKDARFCLRASGDRNPFEEVLLFLAQADISRVGPVGYTDPLPKKGKAGADEDENSEEDEMDEENPEAAPALDTSETFSARQGDKMTLPIRLRDGSRFVELGHWTDDSGRETFKLYSGNRSAYQIARAMLQGVRKKPSRNQKPIGELVEIKTKGITQLWEENRSKLIDEPFNVTTPMGGSFNFDPRGTWTAIDAGYSPNDQKPKHAVEASPVVEFLAAWGLEHARPDVFNGRQVRYATWGTPVSPMLARSALAGAVTYLPMRRFRFKLDLSGKNKIVTFAEEEISL